MTDPLDAVLISARAHGEVGVHVPPLGFEMMSINMSEGDPCRGAPRRKTGLDEPECPGPDCPMCNGEGCALCGAGFRNRYGQPPCEHDVGERHTEPDS